ncbi:hypothetical protein BASA81_008877 [Batrachochytrium salamandrivorans]|nr:hypothetical protein BASA81_008877 [Batrachochytrium salamandrivorans]
MLQVVVPGADLTKLTAEKAEVETLGGGLLRARDGRVVATHAGALMHFQKRLWVAQNSLGRQVAMEGDYVIGIVHDVLGDAYSVDIGSSRMATLDLLAFDGASRRNCPSLARGSLVFARIASAYPDCEPQITCQLPASQQHKKKDWTTGEALFGELKQGCVFGVPPATCRRLSDTASSQLLIALSKFVSFELCVGMNGRVWVNATEDFHIILVGNAIKASAGKQLSKEQAETLVKQFVTEMAKFQPKERPKPVENYEETRPQGSDEDSDVDMVDA